MEHLSETTGNLEVALVAAEKGFRSIPCRPGTKIPLVKWTKYQTEDPTEEEYERWFDGTDNNIAILTTGLVLFDCDDPKKARLVIEHCGSDTPYKVRSPRGGIHLGYRARKSCVVGNHVKIKGMDIDIRAENGLALIPNSRTEHGVYEWLGDGLVPVSQLPLAKISWTRERPRKVQPIEVSDNIGLMAKRAAAYIAKIVSVSGERGHDACFRAVCKIRDFGLSPEEAWPILLAWNETNAVPPWSVKDLQHKISDAYRGVVRQ